MTKSIGGRVLRALFVAWLMVSLTALGTGVQAAEFDVFVAVGVEVPPDLSSGQQLRVGQTVQIGIGGRLLLVERTGCGLGRVFSGPIRFSLMLTPQDRCNQVHSPEEVERRVLDGEVLAENVNMREQGRADGPSTFSSGFNDQCLHLPALSDEPDQNERYCPRGTLLSGLRCSDSRCDNKFLRCCAYPGGAVDTAATIHPTWWISEETGPGRSNQMVGGEFIGGLSCHGDYCDYVLPHAVRSVTAVNSGICSWTPFTSEQRLSRAWCEPGAFVTGVVCTSSYCGSLALRCCRAQDR